jgi:ribosomal protein L14E/L6E/L27E
MHSGEFCCITEVKNMSCKDYSLGQIVYSKSGRDSGNAFIITEFNNDYVWLADGKIRKLDKPKKKKKIHIQITKTINADIRYKLENKLYLLDADLRKALAEFDSRNDC